MSLVAEQLSNLVGELDAEQKKKWLEGRINNHVEAIAASMERNIRRPLPQVQPHMPQDKPIGIVAGGPSLKDFEDEIVQRNKDGMQMVSVNGTHDWLLDRGVIPAGHFMVDSRRFNKRFVKNWHPKCKYFIAAQCHPEVFDTLEGAQVYLYHSAGSPQETAILQDHYMGHCYVTFGGSTVVLRAIQVLRMLGFTHMEMWGFDSCYLNDEHHAYEQAENVENRIVKVNVSGKEFTCTPWMVSQANEFIKVAQHFGEMLHLVVNGDGLIAHLINTHAGDLEEGS